MYGFIDVDRAPGLCDGYAEYQYLAPDSTVLSLPDNVDPILATLFNPLGAGIRWGATLPGTSDGDVVVDVTAKAPAAFAQAIKLVRTAGTVVVAGTRGWGVGAPGFFPDMVVMKEIHIRGALGVDTTAYRAAFDLLASGRYPFADLPRHSLEVPLEEGVASWPPDGQPLRR